MPSVLYTLIAAGDRILVDHTNPRFTGNFRSTAAKLLYKAQNTGKEDTSFNLQGHVFSFRCACDAWFCAVSDEGYGKQMPFVFLKDVADTFAKQFTDVGSLTDSLVKAQFGEKLVAKVDQYSSADDSDKVATAQNNLDDLRVIISDNVNLAVERNMDLNDIADTSLRDNSGKFARSSRRLKNTLCWADAKLKLIGVLVGLLILYSFVASFCGLNLRYC